MSDFKKAGLFSLPVTLIVLVVAFGALIAAGLPLLLALTAVFATMGLLALPSQLIPLDKDISVIVLLIGLAVGVDYSLFYLKREREERAAGRSERAALEAAAATSGRSVLISGLTVMVAMAGMLFTGDKTFMGFGVATMIVVAIAVLGSLTVLPATARRARRQGRQAARAVPAQAQPRGRAAAGCGARSSIASCAARSSRSSLAGGLLLALAAPALHMHIAEPGHQDAPAEPVVDQDLQQAAEGVPRRGELRPGARQDRRRPQPGGHDGDRRAEAPGDRDRQFSTPTHVDYSDDGTIAVVSIAMQGDGVDDKALTALQTLRKTVVPATVGKLDGADVGVTGNTAKREGRERPDEARRAVRVRVRAHARVPAHAADVPVGRDRDQGGAAQPALGRSRLRSPRARVPARLGQAACSASSSPGGIISWLPIFLFVILFGLSMDYHVFILSRIREAFDRGMTTEDAVAHGIKTTAGVVTSAALVMFGVFSIFATLQFMFLKEFGVGLAIAVLVDATIVRAVLLPATMKLLGDWNWYLPRWLEWLPTLDHGKSPESAATETPVGLTPATPQPADA